MQTNSFETSIRRKPRKRSGFGFLKIFRWISYSILIATMSLLLPLRWVDPPTSSYILRYEKAANRNAKHQWVDFDQIAWQMPLAAIAAEDQQFPAHWGLDLTQIRLAFKHNASRSIPRGASTISQQTIKNLFLWPGHSFIRKGLEAWLTISLELLLPKQRILEIYLNIAQFGKSVFGISAASHHYFGKPASELTHYQASLLAASLPTPSSSNPAKPSKYLSERGLALRKKMQLLGDHQVIRNL